MDLLVPHQRKSVKCVHVIDVTTLEESVKGVNVIDVTTPNKKCKRCTYF